MTQGPSLEGAPGGRAATLDAPPLARGFERLSFEARSAADGAPGIFVASCVATTIPGWIDEARPFVTGRAAAFTTELARRAVHDDVTLRPIGETVSLVEAVAPRAGELPFGIARTFVSFDGPRLVTCGAACVRRVDEPVARTFCESAVRDLRIVGTTAPPAPGLLLRALAWGIHRPDAVLAAACAVGIVLATAALVTRRRPRTRPLVRGSARRTGRV